MKSSIHIRTLATQLNFSCHLFSIIFDCRLKRLPPLLSAGLGSSLYSLGADPTENTVSIVLYIYILSRIRGLRD
jgi:hypothetical protein